VDGLGLERLRPQLDADFPSLIAPRLFRLLALAVVVGVTFIKIFPFSSQLFGAAAALGFAAWAGQGRLRRWFDLSGGWVPILAWGVAGGLTVIAADAALFNLFPALGIVPVKLDRFAAVEGNPWELLRWLALIWGIVGITEEIISRSFLIDQWLDILPEGRFSPWLGVGLSAATFSAVHFYEGPAGLISNFVAGLLFGALYILRGRKLASTVIAHSLADSLALIALYLGVVH
jgi:Type II CAAX prenyl endopeptidase Rce1-like